MILKNIFLISLVLITMNTGCSGATKNKAQEKDTTNMGIDLTTVNLSKDLEKILKLTAFEPNRCEWSDQFTAQRTTEVNLFSLGSIALNKTYRINNFDVPNNSYVSFVPEKEGSNTIMTIHAKYRYLSNDLDIISQLKENFGEPELMNDEDSVNTFKDFNNYIWAKLPNGSTLIVSLFSEGVAYVEGEESIKINTALIYVFNDKTEINYYNGQNSTVIEKLTKRFSY